MRYVLFLFWLLNISNIFCQEDTKYQPELVNYLIGSGDVLEIKVYDEEKLTGQYTVQENGSISFPLIGEVVVWNLDIISIQHILINKLKEDYLYDPIINVSIHKYKSQTVYLLGNISKPGAYYLKKPTYLLDLLSDAKGLSQNLGLIKSGQKVDITRKKHRKKQNSPVDTTFSIDLYQLLIKGKSELNIQLKNGDIIYISGQMLIHVVGHVIRPGSFPYEEGMTVLKAMTLAGGVNEKGNSKKVYIKRIVNNKMLRIKSKPEDKIQAEDILEVPLSVW
jgi:polysaccharide export outer membrane protein